MAVLTSCRNSISYLSYIYQKLTALRDVVLCTSDNIIYGDFSKNPDLSCAKPAKVYNK